MAAKIRELSGKKCIIFSFVAVLFFYLTFPVGPVLGKETQDEKDAQGLIRQAQGLYENGRFQQAIEKFHQAIMGMQAEGQESPKEEMVTSVYLMIGICHLKMGEVKKAKKNFIEVLGRKPGLVLDPVLYPPAVIAAFESAKSEYLQALVKEKKARQQEDTREVTAVSKVDEERSVEKQKPQIASVPGRKAKKRFWKTIPLIAAIVVGAAAAVYFLLIKKSAERLHDDFEGAADSNWQPRRSANWSVSDGVYKCNLEKNTLKTEYYEWSFYNHTWSKSNYRIETKIKNMSDLSIHCITLCAASDLSNTPVYQWYFWGTGYFVRKFSTFNFYTATGAGLTFFQEYILTPALLHPGSWNTIQIRRLNGVYTLIVNDQQVNTFTDTSFDPRYVMLAVNSSHESVKLEVDYFYVDLDK